MLSTRLFPFDGALPRRLVLSIFVLLAEYQDNHTGPHGTTRDHAWPWALKISKECSLVQRSQFLDMWWCYVMLIPSLAGLDFGTFPWLRAFLHQRSPILFASLGTLLLNFASIRGSGEQCLKRALLRSQVSPGESHPALQEGAAGGHEVSHGGHEVPEVSLGASTQHMDVIWCAMMWWCQYVSVLCQCCVCSPACFGRAHSLCQAQWGLSFCKPM